MRLSHLSKVTKLIVSSRARNFEIKSDRAISSKARDIHSTVPSNILIIVLIANILNEHLLCPV